MNLLVLLAIGVLSGWLVNLLAPAGRRGDGLVDIGLGAAGAFVCGGLAGGEALLEGVAAANLLAAVGGALALVVMAHVVRHRSRRTGPHEGGRERGRDGEGSGWRK